MIDSLEWPVLLLFVLPALLFVFILAVTGKVRIRAGMGVFVMFSRGALVAALIFLLAGPQYFDIQESEAGLDVLVDVSRSLGVDNRDRLLDEARGFVHQQIEHNDKLNVRCIAFAGKARTLFRGRVSRDEVDKAFTDLRAPQFLASLEPLETDLEGAVRLSMAGLQAGAVRQRIIFTDGAVEMPPAGLGAGVETWILAPQLSDRHSFVANALTTPIRLEEGQPLPMELTYTSSIAAEMEAEIFVDGAAKKKTKLEFQVGTHQISFAGEDIKLGPGLHEILIKVDAGDDEVLDNAVGTQVEVAIKKHVLVVKGDHKGSRAPAVQRALQAQKVDVESADQEAIPDDAESWRRVKAVVLDRVAPDKITASVAARIRESVAGGGGLILIPRDDDNELLTWNRHELSDLLPLTGLPAIKKTPEEEPKEEKKAEKLSDPDIKKSKVKEVEAPTLALLLVIDNSASMKQGGRMLFAIRGAIATLRKLHPEDRIGVVAYNDRATEIVPVQPAGNREAIERAIMRIRPDGATSIETALEFSKTTLQREDAAIKTVVLLSDGLTRPFNVKRVAQDLQACGISVTTVGVGSNFDTGTLTQIAKYSGGTGPIPARNAKQLPAVMVDVASRLIEQNNLRSSDKEPEKPKDDIFRPEKSVGQDTAKKEKSEPGEKAADRIDIRVQRPTSYLDQLPLNFAPSIYGLHRCLAKPTSWVSLATKNGRPVLSHWRAGEGLVAMSSLALEGTNARDLVLWEAYSPLLAQLVRFCSWDATMSRFQLFGQAQGKRAVLSFDDSQSRDNSGAWLVASDDGNARVRSLGQGRYVYEREKPNDGPFLRLQVTPPGENDEQALSLFIPPPSEVASRGLDLSRLEAWAKALGGRFDARRASEIVLEFEPKQTMIPRRILWQGAGLLLLLFAVELLMKRFLRKPQMEA